MSRSGQTESHTEPRRTYGHYLCVHPAGAAVAVASLDNHVAVLPVLATCRSQCIAVCCSVVAVCCSVLQYVAVCCSMLQCVAVCCSVLRQFCAVCCSALQCVVVCCTIAVRCTVAVDSLDNQCVAVRCTVAVDLHDNHVAVLSVLAAYRSAHQFNHYQSLPY